jgi:DNA-binding NarL/FixJ family response regulator
MAAALGAVRERASVEREVRTAEAAYRVRARVLDGGAEAAPAIVVMLERLESPLPDDDTLRAAFGLTARELIVARLLAQDLSNAEIADALTLSQHTARHHTENVLSKLSIGSRRVVRERLQEAAYALGR